MPIAPALPQTGLVGLRLLDKTYDRQFTTFTKSPDIQREIAYFLEKAESVTTVDQLMGDRRLLTVVLGAFGLDDDINKGAFVRKVLDEGTLSNDAFANRLIEPAYAEMAAFLGFGDIGGTLIFESTRLNIVDRFAEKQFELAVGDQDLGLRLAMNFRREAEKIAAGPVNDRTMWLQLLGSPPLRSVVEGALNLPAQFALISLDQQVEELTRRADQLLGLSSPRDLLEGDNLQAMIDRFLLNDQIAGGVSTGTSSGSVALSLLQSSGLGSAGQGNLFASNFG